MSKERKTDYFEVLKEFEVSYLEVFQVPFYIVFLYLIFVYLKLRVIFEVVLFLLKHLLL